MVTPDDNTLRAIIALNKQSDPNWQYFVTWLKDSYLKEGMNTNEIDNELQTSVSKGSVRQLRQLIGFINNAEDALIRIEEARKKANAQ